MKKVLAFIALAMITIGVIVLAQTGNYEASIITATVAPLVITADRKREIFARLRKTHPGAIITPSYIRLEKKLEASQNKYSFSIVRDSNSDLSTEAKLDRNDKFLISDLGLFLRAGVGVPSAEVLQTYPNKKVFGGTNAPYLEYIYNGYMQIKVGSTVFIERLDLLQFRHVPDAQKRDGSYFAINAAGAEATSNVLAAAGNGVEILDSGFVLSNMLAEITPQILFSGDAKNEITLQFPDAPTIASTFPVMVLFGKGFLISSK